MYTTAASLPRTTTEMESFARRARRTFVPTRGSFPSAVTLVRAANDNARPIILDETTQRLFENLLEKARDIYRNHDLPDIVGRSGLPEACRIEIAKVAAAHSALHTSSDIQKYQIQSEEGRIEVAKIAAVENGSHTSLFIRKYEIKSEAARIEIAKIAAVSDYMISQNIKNYAIQLETARIEIAKIAAMHHGGDVGSFFENFEIQSEAAIIEIAKIAAAKDGLRTAIHFESFGIKSEAVRIEIAKIAAAQSGSGVSQYLRHFHIESVAALIEIAKIAAAQDGAETSKYIGNYYIPQELDRIEIAKIAAAQDGKITSIFISNYRITSEAAKAEVAKIAAAQNGAAVLKLIDSNYQISSEEAKIEIIEAAAVHDWVAASEYMQKQKFSAEAMERHPELALIFIRNPVYLEKYSQAVESIRGRNNPVINRLLDEIDRFRIDQNRQNAFASCAHWLGILIAYSVMYGQEDKIASNENLLIALFNIREPQLRLRLTTYLITQAFPNLSKPVEAIFSGKRPLALVMGALLLTFFAEDADILQKYEVFFRSQSFKKGSDQLRFLLNIFVLIQDQTLSHDEKRDILIKLANIPHHKDLQRTAIFIGVLIRLGGVRQLKGLTDTSEVVRKVNKILKEILSLPPMGNYADQYLKLQASFRSLDLAFMYAAKLREGRKGNLLLFGQWFASILNGTYAEIRYTLNRSHLGKVFTANDEKEKAWRLGDSSTIGKLVEAGENRRATICPAVDVRSFLQEKIILHKHYVVSEDSLLRKVLNNSLDPAEAIMALKRKLAELGENAAESKVSNIKIEYYLLQLMETSPRDLDGEPLTRLGIIDKLKDLLDGEQFISDLVDLEIELTERPLVGLFQEREWRVEDTDDAETMLRAGVDVKGSCQRVDGEATLNRCLLSVMLDGKIRMLVIRNGAGKMIARALFRILYDETNKTAVLFMDCTYTAGSYDIANAEEILTAMARRRGEAIGLPVVKNVTGLGPYPFPLTSYGGPVCDEYIDALGNNTNSNCYTIPADRLNVI